MVTLEALIHAGMNEDDAKRIMELYRQSEAEQEPTEAAQPAEQETPAESETTAAVEAEPAGSETGLKELPAEAPETTPEGLETTPEKPEIAPVESRMRTGAARSSENADPSPADSDSLRESNIILQARLIESELRAAGMAAGVRPERLHTLARLADTSKIDVTGENAAQQIAEAVAAALNEVPELALSPFAAGSLGAHPREYSRSTDPFSRGLMGN